VANAFRDHGRQTELLGTSRHAWRNFPQREVARSWRGARVRSRNTGEMVMEAKRMRSCRPSRCRARKARPNGSPPRTRRLAKKLAKREILSDTFTSRRPVSGSISPSSTVTATRELFPAAASDRLDPVHGVHRTVAGRVAGNAVGAGGGLVARAGGAGSRLLLPSPHTHQQKSDLQREPCLPSTSCPSSSGGSGSTRERPRQACRELAHFVGTHLCVCRQMRHRGVLGWGSQEPDKFLRPIKA
jgi:hypothetical protein